eukprot:5232749-Amphidinium_carterae.1
MQLGVHINGGVLTPLQRALSTGSTNPMFSMTPLLTLSEANIKAELLSNKVLPGSTYPTQKMEGSTLNRDRDIAR